MMSYEKQYNFLRDEYLESLEKFKEGNMKEEELVEKRRVYEEYCTDLLEKLLKENQDVLKRLK